MRSFSTVYPQFWNGKTGKLLRKSGAEAQVLALYLITGPHSHMSGVYYLPKQTIGYETGQTQKAVGKGLKELERLGFAFYDEESEHVWVKEMLAWQVKGMKPEDRRLIGVVKWFNSLPSLTFTDAFFLRYQEFLPGLEAPSKVLQSPSEGTAQEPLQGAYIPVSSPVLVSSLKGEGVEGENPERRHGEFQSVRLTEVQYGKLCVKFGKANTDIVISKLDRYSQTAPRKFREYSNHYATVQTWHDMAITRGEIKAPRGRDPTPEDRDEVERERKRIFGGLKS